MTDEQNVAIWIQKQQKQAKIADFLNNCRVFNRIKNKSKTVKAAIFEVLVQHNKRLSQLDEALRAKTNTILREKCFYIWLDKHFSQEETTELLQQERIAKKQTRAQLQVAILKKRQLQKEIQIIKYYKKKLKLKAFFGFMKNLDERSNDFETVRHAFVNNEVRSEKMRASIEVCPIVDKKVDI